MRRLSKGHVVHGLMVVVLSFISVVSALALAPGYTEAESDWFVERGLCWGVFYKSGETYAAAHDAAAGNRKASTVPAAFEVGSKASGYYIWRWGAFFDTETIFGTYGNITVTAATYNFKAYQDYSSTDFDLTVVDASGATDECTGIESFDCDYENDPVDPNYGYLHDMVTSLGSLNTGTISYGSWNAITLNATGLSVIEEAVNNEENLRLGLRSSNDISATEPPGNSYITIDTASSYRAYVEVDFDYEPPAVPPLVPPSPECEAWEGQTLYDADEYSVDWVCGDTWVAENIVPDETHEINTILLALYRVYTPSYATLYVYLADEFWYPTGEALASAVVDVSGLTTEFTGEWVQFNLSNPVILQVGLVYDVVLVGDEYCGEGGGFVVWVTQDYDYSEYDGNYMYTYNAGVDWDWPMRDGLFQCYNCPAASVAALYQTWGYVPSDRPAWYQAWPSALKLLYVGVVLASAFFVYRQKPRKPEYMGPPDMTLPEG